MLLKQTGVALPVLILALSTIQTCGRPLQILYFFSRSFIPDALKIDYNVQDERRIYYNVTAFRPFPGRLLMNFFIRQYGAEKGMPSRDFLKRSNLDFCKTLETLRNMTSEKRTKPFLLQDTFVTSCPLVNGFYYIRNGIIPSVYVPPHMELGRYVVHFELIQVIDELVKLMNLRFVVIVGEGDNAAAAGDSGEGSDNYEDNEDNDDADGDRNGDQHGDDDGDGDDSDREGSSEENNNDSKNDTNDDNDDQDDNNDDHTDDNDSDDNDHNNEGSNEGNNDGSANDNNDNNDNNDVNNDTNDENNESNVSGDNIDNSGETNASDPNNNHNNDNSEQYDL